MVQPIIIALDGMGGDGAPESVVYGAAIARKRVPKTYFKIYGDKSKIEPLIKNYSILHDCCEVIHTEQKVDNDDKPSTVLRTKKQSSMRLALDAVSNNEADCCVSAGNTGALMAMSMFSLRLLEGIKRPAICSFFPTLHGETCMLDLGANIDCDEEILVQFAVMGEVFARTVMGIEKPTVGLLNIGVEEKGPVSLKAAAHTLRNAHLPIQFSGFVEGNDITAGSVDVVVTDGFTGNIALKTIEGTSSLITTFLKDSFQSHFLAKIGYIFASRAIQKLRQRVDPRRYNGAVFLGLNGIAVKSHGGTDAFGFANAINVAIDMATHRFLDEMSLDISRLTNIDKKTNDLGFDKSSEEYY